MSVIPLARAKTFLDVIHNADDAKLQDLLDAAEDEAVQYLGHRLMQSIPVEAWDNGVPKQGPPRVGVPDSVIMGVMLLLQAAYQASPDDAEKLRRAAEVKLSPYRVKCWA